MMLRDCNIFKNWFHCLLVMLTTQRVTVPELALRFLAVLKFQNKSFLPMFSVQCVTPITVHSLGATRYGKVH